MITDIPHAFDASLCVSFRYYLWRINGKPEVWYHAPLVKARGIEGKKDYREEVPAHWQKIPSLDAIDRLDARQILTDAWAEEQAWREANTQEPPP